jgi:hypothetical protein
MDSIVQSCDGPGPASEQSKEKRGCFTERLYLQVFIIKFYQSRDYGKYKVSNRAEHYHSSL